MNIKSKTTLLAIFISAFIVFFPSSVLADSCSNPSDNPCWIAKTPMPTARRDLGVASDASGRIYAVGGFDGNGNFLPRLEVYNPATDSWTTKSPVPVARNAMGFTYNPANGKFYLGGGYNNGVVLNDFYEYDSTTDTWTQLASMQTPSFLLRMAAGTNGKIYSFGGGPGDGSSELYVQEYDPATDTWTSKSAMPNPRSDSGVVAARNGKIYVISGSGNNVILNDVDEYDPITDTWVSKTPISIERRGIAASLNSDGKIYAVGGSDSISIESYTTLVEEYSPMTDTWTTKSPTPFGRYGAGMALSNNGNVYLIGGQIVGSSAINSNYAGFIHSSFLSVPLLKQTAEPWQSHEYDSATFWSPSSPTINAWGCAVTSAAMVFQYHGIKKLPDGTTLDPGTLNSWLKIQPDGYIRNGLVNWLSLSRLSRLAKSNNPNFSHDALEYRRKNGENKLQLTEDLQNRIPGILEEPGHFIVGKGISDATFLINDPFYSRTDLSSYSNTFHSLGRYVPSNTDLSYIMLVVNEGIDISVSSPSGELIGESFIQQPLENDETHGDFSGEALKIFYLPDPESNHYQIVLSSNSVKNYLLNVYLYDKDANVGVKQFSDVVGSQDKDSFKIGFNKDDVEESSVSINITFDSLIDNIKSLRHLGEIKKFGTYISILTKANVAKGLSANIWSKKASINLLKSIQREVERQRGREVSENAYDILSNDVNYLISNL